MGWARPSIFLVVVLLTLLAWSSPLHGLVVSCKWNLLVSMTLRHLRSASRRNNFSYFLEDEEIRPRKKKCAESPEHSRAQSGPGSEFEHPGCSTQNVGIAWNSAKPHNIPSRGRFWGNHFLGQLFFGVLAPKRGPLSALLKPLGCYWPNLIKYGASIIPPTGRHPFH